MNKDKWTTKIAYYLTASIIAICTKTYPSFFNRTIIISCVSDLYNVHIIIRNYSSYIYRTNTNTYTSLFLVPQWQRSYKFNSSIILKTRISCHLVTKMNVRFVYTCIDKILYQINKPLHGHDFAKLVQYTRI